MENTQQSTTPNGTPVQPKAPGFFRRHIKMTVFLLAMLVLIPAGGYVVRKKVANSEAVSKIATQQLQKYLRRNFRFSDVHYSYSGGLVFDDFYLGERGSFGNGDFFKAKQLVLRVKWKDMLKKQFIVEEVKLVQPSLFIRRRATGLWNFSDLGAMPKSESNIQWDLSSVKVENGSILVEDGKTSANILISTINASVDLHRALPLSVKADMDGGLSGTFKGKPLSAGVKTSVDVTVGKDGAPVKTEGEFGVSDAVFADYSAKRLEVRWDFDNLDKPLAEKKLSAQAQGEAIVLDNLDFIAKDKGWAYWLQMPVCALSKVKGCAAPDMNKLVFPGLDIDIRHKGGEWDVRKLRLDGDVIHLDVSGTVSAPSSSVDASFDVKAGDQSLLVKVKGPLCQPSIEPGMSESIAGGITAGFAKLNETLSKLYPQGGK